MATTYRSIIRNAINGFNAIQNAVSGIRNATGVTSGSETINAISAVTESTSNSVTQGTNSKTPAYIADLITKFALVTDGTTYYYGKIGVINSFSKNEANTNPALNFAGSSTGLKIADYGISTSTPSSGNYFTITPTPGSSTVEIGPGYVPSKISATATQSNGTAYKVPITSVSFDGGRASVSTNPAITPSIGGTSGNSTYRSNYGITTTQPSGTDGSAYITFDPGASLATEGVITRAAFTYSNGAGLLTAHNGSEASAADSSVKITASNVTINGGTNLYVPIVTPAFDGGGISVKSGAASLTSNGLFSSGSTYDSSNKVTLYTDKGNTANYYKLTANASNLVVTRADVLYNGAKHGLVNIADNAVALGSADSSALTFSGQAYYIHKASSSATGATAIAAPTVSAGSGTTVSGKTNVTSNLISGNAITDTSSLSGSYFIQLSTAENTTGKTATATVSEGYIPTSTAFSAGKITLSGSTQYFSVAAASMTNSAGSVTTKAALAAGTGDSSASTNTSLNLRDSAPESGTYYSITATPSVNSITKPKYRVSTAGYAPAVAAGSETQLSVNESTATAKTKYIIKSTSSAGSASASISPSSGFSLLDTAPSSGTYYTLTASGSGSSTFSEGYIPSLTTGTAASTTKPYYVLKSTNDSVVSGSVPGSNITNKIEIQPYGYVKINAGYLPGDLYVFSNKADASSESTAASGYSLDITSASGSSPVTIGSKTDAGGTTTYASGYYYPITANNLSIGGTFKASTAGWFSTGTATDTDTDGVTVGRINAATFSADGGSAGAISAPAISVNTTAASSGRTNVSGLLGTRTTSEPSSGYYIRLNTAENTTGKTPTVSVSSAGYVPSGTSSISAAKVTLAASSNQYFPVTAAGYSVTGNKSLSTTISAVTTTATNYGNSNVTSSLLDTSSTGSSASEFGASTGYFIRLTSAGDSTGQTEKLSVTTAGYIPAGDVTVGTVTLNSSTRYIKVKSFNGSVSGSVAGTNSLAINTADGSASGVNISGVIGTGVDSEPSSGYYVSVTGSSSGSGTGTFTASAAGFAPATFSKTGTLTYSATNVTKYYPVTALAGAVSGDNLSGTNTLTKITAAAANSGNSNVISDLINGDILTSEPAASSGYYIAIKGASSATAKDQIFTVSTSGYRPKNWTSAKHSVSYSATDVTGYLKVNALAGAVSGSNLTGTNDVNLYTTDGSANGTNISSIVGTKSADEPSSGYYLAFTGSSSATAKDQIFTASSSGYRPANWTSAAHSVSYSANNATKYFPITALDGSVTGSNLSGTNDVAISTADDANKESVNISGVIGEKTTSEPSSGYFLAVTATSTAETKTQTFQPTTAGYAPTSFKKTKDVSYSASAATKYFPVTAAVLGNNGGAVSGSNISLGGTNNSGISVSGSGSIKVTTAGYAPVNKSASSDSATKYVDGITIVADKTLAAVTVNAKGSGTNAGKITTLTNNGTIGTLNGTGTISTLSGTQTVSSLTGTESISSLSGTVSATTNTGTINVTNNSVTSNGTTTNGKVNVWGGKTKDKGVSVEGRVVTVDGDGTNAGTAVTNASGDLILASVTYAGGITSNGTAKSTTTIVGNTTAASNKGSAIAYTTKNLGGSSEASYYVTVKANGEGGTSAAPTYSVTYTNTAGWLGTHDTAAAARSGEGSTVNTTSSATAFIPAHAGGNVTGNAGTFSTTAAITQNTTAASNKGSAIAYTTKNLGGSSEASYYVTVGATSSGTGAAGNDKSIDVDNKYMLADLSVSAPAPTKSGSTGATAFIPASNESSITASAGTISGSASLSSSNVTLSTTNNGISITASASASAAAGSAKTLSVKDKYMLNNVTVNDATISSTSLTSATKYISEIVVPSGKTLTKVTNNGTITTLDGTGTIGTMSGSQTISSLTGTLTITASSDANTSTAGSGGKVIYKGTTLAQDGALITTSATRSGNTVSWGTGWITSGNSTGATTTVSVDGSGNVSWGTGWVTSGSLSLGTIIPDIDSDAIASYILSGYKAYNESGTVLTGTMTNRGAWTGTIPKDDADRRLAIPGGYHNGNGYIEAAQGVAHNGYVTEGGWIAKNTQVYTTVYDSTNECVRFVFDN